MSPSKVKVIVILGKRADDRNCLDREEGWTTKKRCKAAAQPTLSKLQQQQQGLFSGMSS